MLDTEAEVGTDRTRDPKVFWYASTQSWVMVLFEKDGMSIFNSSNLKKWTRTSHLKGLFECPDFFELPVDGDKSHTKWVMHGGLPGYFIGTFDSKTFTPESAELRYAEGKTAKGEDLLYAAQSFAEMPDGRRVQMAWGRIWEKDMPFTQMMMFPTEFKLVTTVDGLRMVAALIEEINALHSKHYMWSSLTAADADAKLHTMPQGPMQIKMEINLLPDGAMTLRYQGTYLVTLHSADLNGKSGLVEVLIDKAVAEIFVNGGRRYIVRELPAGQNPEGLSVHSEETAGAFNRIKACELKSVW